MTDIDVIDIIVVRYIPEIEIYVKLKRPLKKDKKKMVFMAD